MIILHSISVLAFLAILVYTICFICRYRIIPQSLSVTAEYNGRYRWWQVTICTVMGWLSYWFPTVYTFNEYGAYPILASAGLAGLALAGYYSYSPWEEDKRTLTIHKIGSFSGAVCLCLFYLICLHTWYILIILGVGLMLGVCIHGHRYGYQNDNSIVFWEEIGLISFVGYDIIDKFISSF